jgi:hypothetical protein
MLARAAWLPYVVEQKRLLNLFKRLFFAVVPPP